MQSNVPKKESIRRVFCSLIDRTSHLIRMELKKSQEMDISF